MPESLAIHLGSNGHIAWGFTNTDMDLSDLVVLETEGDGYRTPDGTLLFERFEERIRIKGGAEKILEVLWTIWGPVVDRDHRGRQSAHPRSPFYRAGHEEWVNGDPAPLLPGSTVHRLELLPAE